MERVSMADDPFDDVSLTELRRRHDIAVVADENHAPLTLPGATHTPVVSLGEQAASQGEASWRRRSRAWPRSCAARARSAGHPPRHQIGPRRRHW